MAGYLDHKGPVQHSQSLPPVMPMGPNQQPIVMVQLPFVPENVQQPKMAYQMGHVPQSFAQPLPTQTHHPAGHHVQDSSRSGRGGRGGRVRSQQAGAVGGGRGRTSGSRGGGSSNQKRRGKDMPQSKASTSTLQLSAAHSKRLSVNIPANCGGNTPAFCHSTALLVVGRLPVQVHFTHLEPAGVGCSFACYRRPTISCVPAVMHRFASAAFLGYQGAHG